MCSSNWPVEPVSGSACHCRSVGIKQWRPSDGAATHYTTYRKCSVARRVPSLCLPPFLQCFYLSKCPMCFAALLADGSTDVTVSCWVRLYSFGPQQYVPEKQIAINFALNIRSPRRALTSRPPEHRAKVSTSTQ